MNTSTKNPQDSAILKAVGRSMENKMPHTFSILADARRLGKLYLERIHRCSANDKSKACHEECENREKPTRTSGS